MNHNQSRWIGLVLAVCASGLSCAHEVGWSAKPSQRIEYSVTRKKAVVQGAFTETDQMALSFDFAASRSATVTLDGNATAAITLDVDGTFTPVAADVPLIARLLLANAPPGGADQRIGGSWTVTIPPDSALTNDHVEIQVRHQVTLVSAQTSAGATLLTLRIHGDRRILNNEQLQRLVGLADPETRDPAAAAAADTLARFNPYLSGTVVWNESLGAPESADLVVLVAPVIATDESDLVQSAYRNQLIFARKL